MLKANRKTFSMAGGHTSDHGTCALHVFLLAARKERPVTLVTAGDHYVITQTLLRGRLFSCGNLPDD